MQNEYENEIQDKSESSSSQASLIRNTSIQGGATVVVPNQANTLPTFRQEAYNLISWGRNLVLSGCSSTRETITLAQEGFCAFTALQISGVLSAVTFGVAKELNSADDTNPNSFYII